jgi:DNA mismatch repair ATPase MutS
MKFWLATWAEFEALNALGTYAFEHPENIYPEIVTDDAPAIFEVTGIRHPLLRDCVPNNVTPSPATRFYLISGSNMAGKSTLLRAIGVNAVLTLAGAPIPADSARISPLKVCASIALTDSLADGKSKFLAEVECLHAILAAASPVPGEEAPQPVLFLIDEIFSGTNSLDRRTAAEAILKALVAAGAIGALSTHDLALTEIATPSLHGINVHMASPDPGDPLAFDFLLKPGINTSSSALAILHLVGLPT